jgi:hypothetical protein
MSELDLQPGQEPDYEDHDDDRSGDDRSDDDNSGDDRSDDDRGYEVGDEKHCNESDDDEPVIKTKGSKKRRNVTPPKTSRYHQQFVNSNQNNYDFKHGSPYQDTNNGQIYCPMTNRFKPPSYGTNTFQQNPNYRRSSPNSRYYPKRQKKNRNTNTKRLKIIMFQIPNSLERKLTQAFKKNDLSNSNDIFFDMMFPYRRSVHLINYPSKNCRKNHAKDNDDMIRMFNNQCANHGVNFHVDRLITFLNGKECQNINSIYLFGFGGEHAINSEYGQNCSRIIEELRHRGACLISNSHKIRANYWFNDIPEVINIVKHKVNTVSFNIAIDTY